jgi:hypothetical protein
MKILPGRTEFFHENRRAEDIQTNTTELIVAFRNFGNAPNNVP